MKNFSKIINDKDTITKEYGENNSVQYTQAQSLTDNQKIQARNNIGAGTSNFDGNYNNLSNQPTIPSKTSQLTNDSNFATTNQVNAKYTKPSAGIPKTDLASAVQTSLDYADNAVRYNANQSLTADQKIQARNNIGAGTSNFSGDYKDLSNKPTIPEAVSIVQTTGTSTTAVMSQKAVTDNLNTKLSKTDNTGIEVIGTKKNTTTLGGDQLYAPNGIVFGGTAAAAGLVTRGICGVTTPEAGGACSKDNLYINYDSNNDFNVNRQVVVNAGTVGNHLGSNMYQYAVPRGEIVKNWVEAKGYATTSQVDAKQDAITASNKLSASLVSGLATVATSGSYDDLANTQSVVTTDTVQTITSKKTFNGEVKFGNTENFQGYYIKRMIGSLGAGTYYANLDSSYKDGTWHRMWRLRFPSGSSFWGKIKITLYGGYLSFNASGVMSKSITCNFNTSSIYNNVGCYDGLGVNVEQDFRISEAIWNATASAWEILIWQKNLSGNNSPTIMLECWTTNILNYINAFNGIAAQAVELTQSTSYSAQKASPTGGTKTVEWAALPVYENPLGEEIATAGDLSGKANLNGDNVFTGAQELYDANGDCAVELSDIGAYFGRDKQLDDFSVNAKGWLVAGESGTSGQVLTSQGAGKTPIWKTPSGGGGGSSNVTVERISIQGVNYTVFGNGEYGSFIGTFNLETQEGAITITVGETNYIITDAAQGVDCRLTIDKNDYFVYSTIVVEDATVNQTSYFSLVPSGGVVKIGTNLTSSYEDHCRCVIIKG